MSWDEYVNGYLLNYTDYVTGTATENVNDGAAIIDASSKEVLSVGGNIELRSGDVDQEQDDGSVKKIKLNEVANLLAIHSSQGKVTPAGGVRIKGEKFNYVGKNDEFKSVYLKGSGKGACISKSESLYILSVWNGSKTFTNEKGQKENQGPRMCNKSVEDLQKYLAESGY
jgi:hypothetical protein